MTHFELLKKKAEAKEAKMRKQKPESGGARMARMGKKPILFGPTVEQKKILDAAAEIDGRKTTPFVLHHALLAAKRILEISKESS